MTPITLRDLPRRQRARIYAVALGETSADFALAEALAASAKTGLGAADRHRLAGDAVRYALACHGLHDTTAARIAVTALARGVIPRPLAVLRQARREQRRIERATRPHLALRLLLSSPAEADRMRGAM